MIKTTFYIIDNIHFINVNLSMTKIKSYYHKKLFQQRLHNMICLFLNNIRLFIDFETKFCLSSGNIIKSRISLIRQIPEIFEDQQQQGNIDLTE